MLARINLSRSQHNAALLLTITRLFVTQEAKSPSICLPTCPEHEPLDGQSPATSRTPQFTVHFAVSTVLLQCTNPETCLSDPVIQTLLNFEIAYGQQNSFTAETDLNQRKLASTLKWPHYKFTSSKTYQPINEEQNDHN